MKAILCLLTLPLLAQEAHSIEKERAIGHAYASEVRRQSPRLDDPFVQDYVDRVGVELSNGLAKRRLQYEFEVISGSEWTEPFALPGGYVFIPAGSLISARDENEFAGMLAHAISHAELRHGFPKTTREQAGNTASIPLIFVNWHYGSHADSRNSRLLVPAGVLESQRTYELEADSFGVELAARAGYDASAYLRYVERTQPADSKYSPLPARELRIAAMRKALGVLPAGVRSVSADFGNVQERVRSIVGRAAPRRIPTLRR